MTTTPAAHPAPAETTDTVVTRAHLVRTADVAIEAVFTTAALGLACWSAALSPIASVGGITAAVLVLALVVCLADSVVTLVRVSRGHLPRGAHIPGTELPDGRVIDANGYLPAADGTRR